MQTPFSPGESERLEALDRYQILDTPTESGFDDLVRLAAQICQTPIALVSLVDRERQWFKARYGLDAAEVPRRHAFCAQAILRPEELMEVPDATKDPRFADSDLVTGGAHLRYYLGAPLVTPDGYPLGALCVLDKRARHLSPEQKDALRVLARQVMAQLELRRRRAEIAAVRPPVQDALRDLSSILADSPDAVIARNLDGVVTSWDLGAERLFGHAADQMLGQNIRGILPPDRQAEEDHNLASIRRGERLPCYDTRRLTRDGRLIEVSISTAPIRDGTGQIVGLSDIARDINDRKHAEDALRFSEQRFAAAFARNPAAMILTRLEDGVCVEVNDTFLLRLGYARHEILGCSLRTMDIWPSAEAAQVFRQKLHQKGFLQGWEQQFRKKSGRLVVAQVSAYILDLQGEKVVLTTAVDITRRKRASQALRASEERFRLFMDHTSTLVWVKDKQGRYVYLNKAYEQRFGVTLSQTLGKSDTQLWPPATAARLQANDQTALAASHPVELTEEITDPDGRRTFWLNTKFTFQDAAGSRFLASVGLDITDRKRYQEAVQDREARLRLAVETAELGTYERDLVTNQVIMNDTCKAILGVAEGSLPPDVARRSAYPEDKDRVLAVVARAFDPALREVCSAEFRILRPDGTVRWVAGRGRVVFDDTLNPARPQRFLGVLLDITERKLAEEELLRAKEELSRVNADLEQRVQERTAKLHEMIAELEHMSYSMIHDMRAPLRAIQSFGGILEEDPQSRLSPEAHDLLAKMRAAANRMDQLLTGALDYNSAVLSQIAVEPVNVRQLLHELLAAYPELQPPQAEVSVEGEFPEVLGNEAGLAQCCVELLRNGVKFVGPGRLPRVRVWAEEVQNPKELTSQGQKPQAGEVGVDILENTSEGWVRFWFEDNGTGISHSGQGKIFDMFQRMHGPEFTGTGIGLALVRKIIQRMGGRVGVESEEGKGSRFWVELPAAKG